MVEHRGLLEAGFTLAPVCERSEVGAVVLDKRVIQTRYQLGPTGAYNVEDLPLPYTEVSRQLGMTAGLVKAVETRALIKLRFWATRAPYVPGG
jgi:hypothetical protein